MILLQLLHKTYFKCNVLPLDKQLVGNEDCHKAQPLLDYRRDVEFCQRPEDTWV
jgi:hypothetical protein